MSPPLRSAVLRRAAPSALFVGSVAVVLWQCSRVGLLMDLGFVLNTAYRISAGDVPYKDFTQAQAPLTFLIQAAIIRLFDSTYVHHMWYAALLSGLATLLTLAILNLLLRPRFPRARSYALAASAILVPFGIHSLYPHPWYDADATFFALLALYALLRVRDSAAPAFWAPVAGLLVLVPAFAKQNVGFAFLAAAHSMALPWAFDTKTRGCYARFLAGSVVGATIAGAAIQATCGIDQYVRWTVGHAAERRFQPAISLEMYADPRVWAWTTMAALAVVVATRSSPKGGRWPVGLLGALTLLPLLLASWTAVFLAVWPAAMLLAAALAALRWLHDRETFDLLLVLAVFAVCQAAFLAQGAGGSSFALWPFFCILIACIMASLDVLLPALAPLPSETLLSCALLTVLLTGVPRLLENRRLNYVRTAGVVAVSHHPRLRGLHVSGEYLARLDELLDFFEARVPAADAFTALPGEDPLYFILRRRPHLPLVLFDETQNPYTPVELVDRMLDADIDWLVIKKELQVRRPPQPRLDRVLALALAHYDPAWESSAYLVLRRRR